MNTTMEVKYTKRVFKIILFLLIVLIICYVLMSFWVKKNINEQQIPVLMYHDVVPDEYYRDLPDKIKASSFEKQLKYLKDNNYKPLTLDEFYCFKKAKCDVFY